MKSFYDILNVKLEERKQVTLMLITGFFMGTFVATYSVTAEALFINKLSIHLNKAFLFSGILGILATFIFTFLQNRIKFTNLTIASVLSVLIFTTLIYLGYKFSPEQYKKYVLFIMYCSTGPMTAILLLCYWGVFGRLFNFRQSKRIISWIDTGQLVASNVLTNTALTYDDAKKTAATFTKNEDEQKAYGLLSGVFGGLILSND